MRIKKGGREFWPHFNQERMRSLMKKRGKLFAGVLAAVMMTSVFAGCSTSKQEANTDVTKVVWWRSTGHDKAFMQEKFKQFNETVGKEKGIELEYVVKEGDMEEMLNLAYTSDQAPDLYATWQIEMRAQKDQIMPLEEIAGAEKLLEKFGKNALETRHKYLGKTYTLPITSATYGLIYNKQMFKDAGLVDENGEPKAPETWDQVVEYAKKLTNPDAKQYGIIFPGKWDGFYTTDINMASSAINGMTDAYDPRDGSFHYDGQITVLNAMIQMKRDGSCVPGTEGIDNDPARARFGQGDIGMKIAGSYDYGVLTEQFPAKIEWGVAPLPVESSDVKGIQYASADGLCSVNKSSVERIGADKIVTILDYFTSDDMLKEMYQAGLSIPIDYDLVKDVKVSDDLANWKTFASFAAFSKCPPLTVKSDMTGEKTMSDLCVEMLSETSSPSEVEKIFKDYEKKQNDGVAKYKELHPDYDPTPFIYPDWQLTR